MFERVAVEKLVTTKAPSQELVDSIREIDVLNPIIVRRSDLTVIDGERRLAACKIVDFKEIPVIFVDVTDEQVAEAKLMRSGTNITMPRSFKKHMLTICEKNPEMTLKELAEKMK